MKLALVSLNDSADVHEWSGLNYHIARSLERAGATLHRIGPLAPHWTLSMRLRQRLSDVVGRPYHAVQEPAALDALGAQARGQLPPDADAVLAVTSLIAAAIGKATVPVISWDDASPASLHEFYPDFKRLSPRSIALAHALGRRATHDVSLAMYASEWAADSARSAYGLSADRVAVVPFGANMESLPAAAEVRAQIDARDTAQCQLLWIGVEWERKGGPLTLAIAQGMRSAGVPVRLTIVGCEPAALPELPEWAHAEGFISKRTAGGEARIAALFARSHFFVMPSNAEAYGLVYAEAAAFGVPSIANAVGGVPTLIVDGETGVLAPAGSGPEWYAQRIAGLWGDRPRYLAMASAARLRAESLLNWDAAGRSAVGLVRRVLER